MEILNEKSQVKVTLPKDKGEFKGNFRRKKLRKNISEFQPKERDKRNKEKRKASGPLIGRYRNPDKEWVGMRRIKIIARDIGSFLSKQMALECSVTDYDAHVISITETNVTPNKISLGNSPNFSCADQSRGIQDNIKGGLGGGVMIFVR